MKIDLHVHSDYSDDAVDSPKKIIKHAKKKGLDGIAIVDHNNVKGGLKGLGIAKEMKDFAVIPGAEISSAEGHILALDIKENISKKLSVKETVEKIISLGGIPVLPHPYRMISGLGKKNAEKFTGIEVFNSRSMNWENKKAESLAKKLDIGKTGGSDAHSANEVGYGITEFNINSFRIDDLLHEIEKKRTNGYGILSPRNVLLRQHIKSLRLWFRRGRV